MDILSLALLGPFRATLADRPLATFRSSKVQALLIFLTVEAAYREGSHPRDTLMELLWPGIAPTSAQENLRQILYQLRKAIPGVPASDTSGKLPLLIASRRTIQLNPAARYTLDVATFRALLAGNPTIDEMEQAIALYRGDFLADFSLADSEPFEEWATTTRENLRQGVLRALDTVTSFFLERGDDGKAEPYARRQIAIDPLGEQAHQRLMTILARSGRRNQALMHYDEWRRQLDQELGIAPSAESEALYDGIRADSPPGSLPLGAPPRRATAPRGDLPATTPLIGREKELAEVSGLVADPEVRLVTLLGAGGMGKSRLGLAVAERYLKGPAGTGGAERVACFVPLAPLSSPAHLPSAIADALGFPFYGADDPKQQLFDYLRSRELLLLFDNFEHLVASDSEGSGGATFVADLLHHAPHTTVLVTSRERLNLSAEWTYEVEGLEIPEDAAGIDTSSAGQLFLRQARRVRRDVGNQPAERAAIARICRLVGGMPLAIELSASWVGVLSCEEIAAEIEQNLDFLATTFHDLPERHRSMRAVFEHSWSLLSDAERSLFRRVAVFRGNFTREAVELICVTPDAVGPVSQGHAREYVGVLASLVGKSFVRLTPSGRYEVHEVLRQYGAAKLEENRAERRRTRDRHCEYYLALLAGQDAALKGHARRLALATLGADFDNVHAAWRWALKQGRVELLAGVGDSLWLFYDRRRSMSETEGLFAHAVATLTRQRKADPPRERQRLQALAKALACQGAFTFRRGSYGGARALLGRSIELFRQLDDPREMALALNWLAATGHLQGAYEEECQLLEESIALARGAGDRWLTAYSLNDLGMATQLRGGSDEAQRLSRESLALFREIEDVRGMAFALHNLGVFAHQRGEYEVAEQFLQESLSLRRADDDLWGVATTLTFLGAVARARGDPKGAHSTLCAALDTAMRARALPVAQEALVEVAALLLDQGQPNRARELLEFILRQPTLSRGAREIAEQLAARLPASPLTLAEGSIPTTSLDVVVASLLDKGVGEWAGGPAI